MTIELSALDANDHSLFIELTTTTYKPNYGDVDSSMAKHILDTHVRGNDIVGYMTIRKEVFSVRHEGKRIGFTTTTWKRGGAVKTGPTILFPEARGKGLGPQVQKELQRRAAAAGGRKIYGTVSSANERARRYMINAGYSVEATLKNHYAPGRDELIFGYFLRPPTPELAQVKRTIKASHVIRLATGNDISSHCTKLLGFFERDLVRGDELLIRNISSACANDLRNFAAKPKRIFLAFDRKEVCGAAIFSPKRGGVLKLNIIGDFGLTDVRKAVDLVRSEAGAAGFRKIFAFIPAEDPELLDALVANGWMSEGKLREPYMSGKHMALRSLFLG